MKMKRFSWVVHWALAVFSGLAFALTATAQIHPDLYAGLRWRNVGPFHGGRVATVAGVVGEPNVYYAGTPEGGLWKTTSAGVTWYPIFDHIKQVDSIGAVAVAPSDPDIVYVGTGDPTIINPRLGSLGDGVWKSTNAGKTWHHMGLKNSVFIDNILVDPKNPNVVIVSALGNSTHPGGGIWRSTNGGLSWTRVLDPAGYKGTREVVADAGDFHIMLAVTQGTGGPFFAIMHGPKAKPKPPLLFKSTNGGLTWSPLKIPPFPGRVAVAVARHGRLIYIVGNNIEHGSGLFRSDNGGITWRHMAKNDKRISNGQGSYSCGVFVDPKNPNILYTVSTAMYRSTNGGVSFQAFKGAPGGEDYHDLWIDPHDGRRMVVASDQGASVTLNNGKTWSLWYTETFSQIYHVATTHQFHYWIIGAQQDTGAVMIRNQSNWGQVDFINWSPVPSSEFGYITPDPLNPHILYGVGYGPGGGGSGLVKINMVSGQWESIAPNFGVKAKNYWGNRSLPKKFDTVFDPHALYIAYQCLLVSHDGGHSWRPFSPNLTTLKGKPLIPCGQPLPPAKKIKGKKKKKFHNPFAPPGPVINDFSISKVRRGVVWTVSSNNQIYLTRDGGQHWKNVTNIKKMPPHTHLHTIEAGDEAGTAYVTGYITVRHGPKPFGHVHIAGIPLIWRTTNNGRSWVPIVRGVPSHQRTGSWVNVLRADPKQPGLLFVGTGTTVYVSFDNGNRWHSLRQNLPSTSITDLVVHTAYHMNDLVISTFGRGFWVLDDITPLRQLAAHPRTISHSSVYFFKPEEAIRSRENSNWDQPFSIEVPHAPNPPYGVIVDYYLRHKPKGPIQLKIFDAHGHLVRTYSSILPPPIKGQAYPRYWLASPQSRALPIQVGLNRFSWNLRYAPPPAFHHDLENQMNTVAGSTTPGPHGPQVIPGVYTLKLTVNGKVYTRHVTVMNDPRVGQSPALMADLRAQNRLTMQAYHGMQQTYVDQKAVHALQVQLATLMHKHPTGQVALVAKKLMARLTQIAGKKAHSGFLYRFKHPKRKPHALRSFINLNNHFNTLVSMMQVGLDMAPTAAQIATLKNDCQQDARTVAALKTVERTELRALNRLLEKNHLKKLRPVPSRLTNQGSCGSGVNSSWD